MVNGRYTPTIGRSGPFALASWSSWVTVLGDNLVPCACLARYMVEQMYQHVVSRGSDICCLRCEKLDAGALRTGGSI